MLGDARPRFYLAAGQGLKNMTGEKKIYLVGSDLSIDAKARTSIGTVKPDPTWLCPVCGLKRNLGNIGNAQKLPN
ncbi:MAG: hypothetical protein O2966_06585 [Proteobacteria bacterium]|nr:hypothetical protein [Pseudomonadota bacterium]